MVIKNLTVAAKLKSTYNPGYCDGIPTSGIEIYDSQNILFDSLSISSGEDVSINFSISGGIGLLIDNSQNIEVLNSKISGAASKVFGNYRCSKDGGEGIKVSRSDRVKIINCEVMGGQGGNGWAHGASPAMGGYGGNALTLLNSSLIEINSSYLMGGIGGVSNAWGDYASQYQSRAGDGAFCNNSNAFLSNSTLEGGTGLFRQDSPPDVLHTFGGNGLTAISNSSIIFDGGNLIRGSSSEDANGELYFIDRSSSVDFRNVDPNIFPSTYLLKQNYPNPFNSNTKIVFSIPQQTFVLLKIFDLLGGEVATLVNEEKQTGYYEIEFNGSSLPSGVYFYQLKAGNFVETKKMILLR